MSSAGVAVIVNSKVTIDALTPEQASMLFLGKIDELPNGTKMVPIDQDKDSSVRSEFHNKVTKKNQNQLNAYWSRKVFTGKGTPPKEVMDDEEVVDLVKNNPNLIGYINSSEIPSGVKVLISVD
jgi:ABC-type phosphate transport system substrate-binding protein